ncbi:hypothetical protein AMATHDRAFT_5090 [Amanita thiersii Skay4041]|uniref:C3H1-type domain-containing protein n=1 Tax=Amanita thiersii Skay4041 TaxID=703135 RepID=A0A2A9NGJ3_9AGAR|nr:hypothetical protein AMATHDRAFT_5090 [Amanita thiersii Skay4041]
MQVALTKPSATTKDFFSRTSDDLLPPISLTTASSAKDTLNWPLIHDSQAEVNIDNWNLSTSNETTPRHRSSTRRTISTNLQSFPYTSTMSRIESHTTERGVAGTQRWRLNTKGQLVDSDARGWDLADEIGRLKLGEVDTDVDGEDVHGPVRTPPKSKLAAAAVAQLSESSPLDSSSTSAGSSPHTAEQQISISHSRGSSTDTSTTSSHDSSVSTAGNSMLAHPNLKTTSAEAKERPHSFSGGLSAADLRRLQQVGDIVDAADMQKQPSWAQNSSYLDSSSANSELSYPSLTNHIHRPQPQLHPQLYEFRTAIQPSSLSRSTVRDDGLVDYNTLRDYPPHTQNVTSVPTLPGYVQGQPLVAPTSGLPYRQQPRVYPQQSLIASPNLGYQGAHHTAHLSLGNTQQLYDMMLPTAESHPAIARVQQQHNIFRPTHHHSASDPSAIRDPANLALLNNVQTFGAGMFQTAPLPMFDPARFYGQDVYSSPGVNAVQMMAARLQQFGGTYDAAQTNLGVEGNITSVSTPTSHQPGPSANNRKLGLYKTELCRSWEEKGSCRYGAKCQFAHGEEELRKVARHPKYKTEICRTFWVSGSCPYGKRCCFIHTELPSSGHSNAGSNSGTENGAPQSSADGRARSLSTNSDPNDTSVSLLARISAKRNQEASNGATTIDTTSKNISYTRPPTGTLRVDTSALDGASIKQNKSAYPSFASNGILLPATEQITAKSPGPVTAGPDLGRHNAARLEIVGYNNRGANPNSTSNNSIRHSFNGSDVEVNFSQSPPIAGQSNYGLSSIDSVTTPRANGHVRAGSAGNWASFSRSSHLSAFPHGSSPAGDIIVNAPWSSADLAVGSTRLGEKAWA